MAKKKKVIKHGKQRTRQHIIEDISHNYVERMFLFKGFSYERIERDYGLDAFVATYNSSQEIENGYLTLQLKATDSLSFINGNSTISFTLHKTDLNHWMNEVNPVVLILFDAKKKKPYWLYIQNYLQTNQINVNTINITLNVHIPAINVFNEQVINRLRKSKNTIYQSLNIQHVI